MFIKKKYHVYSIDLLFWIKSILITYLFIEDYFLIILEEDYLHHSH